MQYILVCFAYLDLSGPVWISQHHQSFVLSEGIHVVLAPKITAKQVAGASRNRLSEPRADEIVYQACKCSARSSSTYLAQQS